MATALGKVRETWNQIANESGPIEVAQAAHNMAQITALATIALAEQQEIANLISFLAQAPRPSQTAHSSAEGAYIKTYNHARQRYAELSGLTWGP